MTKRKSTDVTKQVKSVQKISEATAAHTEGNFHIVSFGKKYWAEALVIMVLSFVLYHSCLPYSYVLDDQIVITGNSFTKKGFGGIYDIMTTESFEGYFGEKKDLVQGNRYRPLSIITFAIEYGILGDVNPMVSHFINILLYGMTCILLMMVLELLFRNFKPTWRWMSIPFLASMIFLVHPIHTEAVANIKGRDEIMSMFFSLLALYGGLRYMDNKSIGMLLLTAISYFLGLLSKENAITFLAVIPLTIYFFSEAGIKHIKNLVLILLGTTILYLIIRFSAAGVPKLGQQAKDLMNNPFLEMTGGEKFGSILYTLGKYIALMVFPHPLSHDYYPYAIPKVTMVNIFSFTSLILYIGLIYVGLKGMIRKSIYSYSVLYYLITLTIVSNIVINLGTFMNERFIFMASAGYCIAVAYFLSHHLPTLKNALGAKIGISLAIVMVVGYSVKTYLRVPVWKDALSLNQAAVDVSSNSARANSFMSTALFEEYKITSDRNKQKELLDKAEYYGKKAADIIPNYQNANLMLIGVAAERYKMNNDINAYIRDMQPSVLRRPDIPFIKEFSDYLKGRGHDRELYPFYKEIGTTLLDYKDTRRNYAAMYLLYAYDINPNDKPLVLSLATAYELAGRPDDANKYKAAAQSIQ